MSVRHQMMNRRLSDHHRMSFVHPMNDRHQMKNLRLSGLQMMVYCFHVNLPKKIVVGDFRLSLVDYRDY
jgi:hypothetical protein